jgi:hypothetical protein
VLENYRYVRKPESVFVGIDLVAENAGQTFRPEQNRTSLLKNTKVTWNTCGNQAVTDT